ncbi:xanthine dehydrogenase family protein molybdopterin-binding subunit [Novosphingobium sp. BW1]|uniref:xanthine dehydrogenase family protein molybdopterin-binding subunit n=1 Tax=Novosphingobium sp. BW1 TaxID=2592621 RepID=UPI0011DEC7CE|nr:molybdopterin cofactor-binding domain-containing protein [Novosphingobium sp. BW1]TYC89668.1 xanthine dehydrogenase family protein molybdopterin-binding subunit [Novosphingobium sp. BW1]
MTSLTTSRRTFVVMASSGLLLGLIPKAARTREIHRQDHPFGDSLFRADQVPGDELVRRFLEIAPDGTVTVFSKHLDMGQGTWSGLASLVAEELDANWTKVRVTGAPVSNTAYANHMFQRQATGGSTSLANSWDELRRAGAVARAMVLAAAARSWGVHANAITLKDGVLSHGARTATLGDFAQAAAHEEVPHEVALKPRAAWRLLGRDTPRTDMPGKVTGATKYGIDGAWQDMRHAVIARSSRFGARLLHADTAAAGAMPGVEAVVEIPSGIAVIARTTWHALRARDALTLTWSDGEGETRSDAQIARDHRAAMDQQPPSWDDMRGDPATMLARAATRVEAEFTFPYLAHAAMEPLALLGQFDGTRCKLRGGFQTQADNRAQVAAILGLEAEAVELETVPAGGSFGRRAGFTGDWVVEFAQLLKAARAPYPIKLTWTREDDMRGGHYRPLMVYAMQGGLDAQGRLLALDMRLAGQSVTGNSPYPKAPYRDITALEGNFHDLYDHPHSRLRFFHADAKVPVVTYRSISNNHTGVAKEIFVDRLARAAGADPVAFRLALLGAEPRQAQVLRVAAKAANWDTPPPRGITRGVAVHRSEGSCVAQVAELSGSPEDFRIERIVSAVDCGLAVNPDTVRAQVEGGTGFGLSSALYGEINLDNGAARQSNFDGYRLLRMNEMPRRIEVHMVESGTRPSGIGEPGSVPGAPAVINALERMGMAPVSRLPVFAST